MGRTITNSNQLDLRLVRHFLTVVEHRSFHRGAKSLRLTQPALSKSIRALESLVGGALFERRHDGVVLTEMGTVMLGHAKLIATEVEHALDAVSAARTGTHGVVVVGAALSAAETLLPQVTARLVRRIPGIRVKVLSGLHENLISMLRVGDVDLVISSADGLNDGGEIVNDPLYVDYVDVIARKKHPLLTQPDISMAKVGAYPWALLGPQILSKQKLDSAFLSVGLPAPAITIESDSPAYLKALLLESDFISFMPHYLIERERRSGKLLPVPLRPITWTRPIGICYRRRGSLSPAALAFVAEARAYVDSEKFR
jgi:DNA-binding transcriptional LysR family regulator